MHKTKGYIELELNVIYNPVNTLLFEVSLIAIN